MPPSPTFAGTSHVGFASAPRPARAMRPLVYQPALDGLRGVATLLVLAYHLVRSQEGEFGAPFPGADIVQLGWLGVDLFFVLSGFLITGILVESRERSDYYRTFLLRRALRILPLYYLVVVLHGIVRATRAGPVLTGTASPAWLWGYAPNVALAFGLEHGINFGVLDHFWSLAIEEQFYLVWPLVVRACDPRALGRLCLALVAVVPVARAVVLLAGAPADVAYMLTPLRVDGLALGALVAIAAREPLVAGRWRRHARVVLVAAVLAFGALVVRRGAVGHADPGLLVLGIALANAMGAAVIVLALSRGTEARVLGTPFLRWCGRRSYGLYVWHPVVMILAYHTPLARALHERLGGAAPALVPALCIACTVAVAEASWRWWERPFIALKDRVAPVAARA